MTPPTAESHVLVPVNDSMDRSVHDEDAVGERAEDTEEVTEVSESSTAVSPEPLPIQVKGLVRGSQRATRGRGTKDRPYLVGFGPSRPRGVPPAHPYNRTGRRRVSRGVSLGDSSTLGDTYPKLDSGRLPGKDRLYVADRPSCCRATRVSFIAQMPSGPDGWGIGWKPVCSGGLGSEGRDDGVVEVEVDEGDGSRSE